MGDERALEPEKYLARIGYRANPSVDATTLRTLHRHHVLAVPFEAMDVQLGRAIRLELPHLYEKVIVRRRGGFCYELNYLFAALLRQLGFDVELVSARIWNEGAYGPEFDHMALVVRLAERWLADVGFGRLFIEPLRLDCRETQADAQYTYSLERTPDGEYELSESRRGADAFTLKYRIDPRPRRIEEFASQCDWKQSAATSYFVRNTVCTLPTEDGRRTILNDTFAVTERGVSREVHIESDAHLCQLLREEFGISR